MNYTLIDPTDAPPRSPAPARRQIAGLDDLMDALVPGKVLRIDLSDDDKPRVISDQLFKTAARNRILIDVWDAGGKLYVELLTPSS